jgi:CheY-like chemotaxis protein
VKPHSSGAVLVVDDEEIVRETAREALERYGYEVLMAESGPAAIGIFSTHPGKIAAVLLDMSMPGMSGGEVLPELLRIRPEVKIVVSSGDSETEAMKRLQGKRVAGFIPKPYTAVGLAKKIAEALE